MPPTTTNGAGKQEPKYDPPEPSYATGSAHNLQIYLDFMQAQITELLTNYGPVAAIWLDGIAVPNNGDRPKFKCQELYDYIHSVQPQVLVSYKQGLLGTEDFQAPEHQAVRTGKQTHGNLYNNVFWTRRKRRILGLSRRRRPPQK